MTTIHLIYNRQTKSTVALYFGAKLVHSLQWCTKEGVEDGICAGEVDDPPIPISVRHKYAQHVGRRLLVQHCIPYSSNLILENFDLPNAVSFACRDSMASVSKRPQCFYDEVQTSKRETLTKMQ